MKRVDALKGLKRHVKSELVADALKTYQRTKRAPEQLAADRELLINVLMRVSRDLQVLGGKHPPIQEVVDRVTKALAEVTQ